jgi:Cu+-exporting ATPase
VAGRRVAVGAPRFLTEETGSTVAWPVPSSAETVVGVAVDGSFAGHLLLSDPPRPESTAVVAALRRAGRRVVMLTGDQRPTAVAVAQEVGIDEIYAETLPPEKVAVLRSLQQDGEVVAMVGDGLNDAAALAQADIGIAIGAGADVAAEASDLTLVRPDLSGVLDAFALSERTFRIIVQNFAYAFLFNGIGLPLAAAGFLNPALAALSMGVSSVAVVGNSLRLRARTPWTAAAAMAEGSEVDGDRRPAKEAAVTS